MSARLMAICFSIFFLSNCRSTNSQLKQDGSQAETSNYRLFNNDFEWLGSIDNGTWQPTRTLTYCVEDGTDPLLVKAFEKAIKHIDQIFINTSVKWEIKRSNNECPKSEPRFLSQKNPGIYPNLRIRSEALEPIAHPTNPNESISFDAFSTSSQHLQNANAAEANSKTHGMIPHSEQMAENHVAEFLYNRISNKTNYIVTADIVFYTHTSIQWDTQYSDKQTVDPDLVALHMLGHALKLSHSDDIFDDAQLIPCGSAAATESTVAIKASQGRALLTKTVGDDQLVNGGAEIAAGANRMVESSKTIPIMFPFFRLGTHCVNPTSTNEEDRYHFTELERDTLRRTASIDGV